MKNVYTVKGVMVLPEKRQMKGVELFIENGKVLRVEERDEIKTPFILPGFIDAHVHIESSMLIPSRFARMAVKHGTVAVVTDPHEVANVAGVDGIEFMQNDASKVPMKFFFGLPSCVPASPMEKSGAIIGALEVEQLIKNNSFYYLAEMMNFPGVIYNDTEVHRKLAAAKELGKPIDGHAPGLAGEDLKKYIEAGITTDHECSTIEEAVEKINLGMKILIREGSAAKNYKNLIPLIKDYPDAVMFCTDDCHPDYLQKGHINKIVAQAIKEGYNLFDVLKATCINPVLHYKIPVGFIQEGSSPDFVVVSDLVNFDVLETYIKGEKVYGEGKVLFPVEQATPYQFPFRDTFNKNALKVYSKGGNINVIGAIDGELITKWIVEPLTEKEGEEVLAKPETDFLKIVLLDRYSNTAPVVGFIRGFGLNKGAIAASIAHDSHHIVAVGCDDTSIDAALDWIVKNRGGLCYTNSQEVDGIPLPFFGLMTDVEGQGISERYQQLNKKIHSNGCTLSSPFMTASFMALTVIPELKIYHKGLFDGIKFQHVDVMQ